MGWVYLTVAGLLEVGWVIGLKESNGLTKPVPVLFTVIAMVASMVLLAGAVRTLPIGTSYAVWTGIGAIGAVIAGIAFYGEPSGVLRLAFVAMILAGIVGLKLTTP